ncbi:MAG: autorepressor SdpR family transcription factor [Treponema sp.]|nr:autorepressor SdpR family transcription factor [Treponema sp.]
MADVWTAVADKTRRQILGMLRKKSMTAGEIAACFDISKPSISHHLDILQQAHLISCEKDGQRRIYTLNMTVWQDFIEFVAKMTMDCDKKDTPEEGNETTGN